MNEVKLEGNLGKDAKIFPMADNNEGVFVSLAVENGGKTNDPTWVRCFAYGSVADGMKKLALKKGNRLHIEGELRLDKENALFVKVLGGKRL